MAQWRSHEFAHSLQGVRHTGRSSGCHLHLMTTFGFKVVHDLLTDFSHWPWNRDYIFIVQVRWILFVPNKTRNAGRFAWQQSRVEYVQVFGHWVRIHLHCELGTKTASVYPKSRWRAGLARKYSDDSSTCSINGWIRTRVKNDALDASFRTD